MRVRFNAFSLTFCLILALMIRASRALAQDEDYGAYRHEFYREDDHRMSIDTDSAEFDIGFKPLGSTGKLGAFLAEHMRLTGDFVYDGISGATPTGAPPLSVWPFPTYSYYFNQRFQSAINDPNNLILYQQGYFSSYQAYTNYVAANSPGIAIGASNDVKTLNQQLSTNALYRSGGVPTTHLHDIRRAFSIGTPWNFGIHTFTPEVSISKESDYHSYGFSLNYSALLNKKNTTLNAGWSHDCDRVRDDNLIWEGKVSDDFLIGLTQLLTPKSYITLDLTYGQEYGYLSDPYRAVMFLQNNTQFNPDDASLTPENRPRRREKEIAYVGYTQFIDALDGSAVAGYRFYHDTYGIFAHTLDLTWNQKLGNRVVLSPGFRYYYQTAAHFYAVIFPDFDAKPADYSSDYRLSRLETITASISLNYRIQKHVSLDLTYMRYIMQGLDGVTSQSAYPAANVGSVGARIFF